MRGCMYFRGFLLIFDFDLGVLGNCLWRLGFWDFILIPGRIIKMIALVKTG